MELNTNRSMLHPEQGSQAIVMTHEHSIPSLHTSNKRTARNWYSNKNTKCCAQHTVPVIKTLSSILPCWQCYWFVSLWLQLLNEGWFFKDKVLGVLCSKVYFANRNFMPTGCTLLVLHCKGYVFCFCVFFQSNYSHLYICIFKSGYQKNESLPTPQEINHHGHSCCCPGALSLYISSYSVLSNAL